MNQLKSPDRRLATVCVIINDRDVGVRSSNNFDTGGAKINMVFNNGKVTGHLCCIQRIEWPVCYILAGEGEQNGGKGAVDN